MHRYSRALSCVIGAALNGCSPPKSSDSGHGTEVATEGTITAVTYNVHGLPSLVTGDDTPGRMALIAPRISDYDIVGLQEDFTADNHALLTADSSHETQLWFGETLPERPYSSGLSTLIKAPLLEHQHQHYSTCHGHTDSGSDCFASKGFQALRVSIGTDSIDVYNTHLEAGGSAEDNAARHAQVDDLISALTSWSDGQAVIFTGDFNLRETDPEDLPLIDQLLEDANLTRSCAAVDCDEPAHIDKILFRASPTIRLEAEDWENVSERFEDTNGLALSDHPAISATFIWKSR